MRRREFLRGAGLAAGTMLVGRDGARLAPLGKTARVQFTINLDKTIAVIPSDFVGLGYEISSVARPGLLSEHNTQYVQLVRTLGSQGVIRVGGNTSDYATYAPSAQPLSSPETGPGSVVNDAVLRDLGAFLKATGWKLIWGLNLGRGTKEEAVAEAKAVLATTSPNLIAFEIGNEPDLFSHREIHRKKGYDYDHYLAEYRRFRNSLRKEIPGIPLAGPDVAVATSWVSKFARDEGNDLKLLTRHYYREGQNPSSTIARLLAPDPKLAPLLAELEAASKSCGVPFRICETNSFSGGGKPGVSDRFAAALWVLSFMYKLASAQCAGVNMETGVNQLGFISSYSPIGEEDGHYRATPEYYGMLAFARSGRGELVESNLENAEVDVEGYATKTARQISITLINKSGHDVVADVDGAKGFKYGSVLSLSAPSIDSVEGFLGGAVVDAEGRWSPRELEKIQLSQGKLRIHVPGASGAMVELSSSVE
jgi:hypothetical protein